MDVDFAPCGAAHQSRLGCFGFPFFCVCHTINPHSIIRKTTIHPPRPTTFLPPPGPPSSPRNAQDRQRKRRVSAAVRPPTPPSPKQGRRRAERETPTLLPHAQVTIVHSLPPLPPSPPGSDVKLKWPKKADTFPTQPRKQPHIPLARHDGAMPRRPRPTSPFDLRNTRCLSPTTVIVRALAGWLV